MFPNQPTALETSVPLQARKPGFDIIGAWQTRGKTIKKEYQYWTMRREERNKTATQRDLKNFPYCHTGFIFIEI